MVAPDVQPLLIFPCNGNGIEAVDCLDETYELIGLVDDAVEKRRGNVHGCPIYGREALSDCSSGRVLAVPGSPSSFRSRSEIVGGLHIAADRFATVIHPLATVSHSPASDAMS